MVGSCYPDDNIWFYCCELINKKMLIYVYYRNRKEYSSDIMISISCSTDAKFTVSVNGCEEMDSGLSE